jgi:hypothetical protein
MRRTMADNDKRLLIRDIVHCKPGKVRPMAEKFLAVARLYEQLGMGSIRVLTDVSAERYWTVVSEIEVESLEAYRAMEKDPRAARKMEQIMEGYHDLVDQGRREIYAIEYQAA